MVSEPAPHQPIGARSQMHTSATGAAVRAIPTLRIEGAKKAAVGDPSLFLVLRRNASWAVAVSARGTLPLGVR